MPREDSNLIDIRVYIKKDRGADVPIDKIKPDLTIVQQSVPETPPIVPASNDQVIITNEYQEKVLDRIISTFRLG